MKPDEILSMIDALRSRGAVEVSAGGVMVRFAGPVVRPEPKPAPSVPEVCSGKIECTCSDCSMRFGSGD